MKHLLFLPALLIGILLLCHSCRKEVAPTCPALFAADSIMWSNPDSALQLLQQITNPQDFNNPDRAFYALLLTQARYKSCVPLENDSLIRIAVDYYEGGKEKERLAKSYFYWGCVHAEKQEGLEAIDLYLKSLELMLGSKDSTFLAMLYSHLGDSYTRQRLRSAAREMYVNGYALCMNKDSVRACYALNNIGDTYLVEYQLDSALVYYKQALEMASALQYSDLLFTTYNDISALYNEQEKYAEAEDCISKALLYQTDKQDYTLACSIKGDILKSLNSSDSAIYYWKKGAESSNIYVKASSYNHLFQEYKETEDWKEATIYVDSFLVYYDSIQEMNDRAELDRLMDNHLVELHKHELSVKNNWIVMGLIVFFLLLAATLVILYLWRDSRRRNKYANLQQRLMENRAESIFLNEASETPSDDKTAELQKLEEERFHICLSLFETTAGSKKLDELKKATPAMQIKMADTYRVLIVSDIRKSFADVMGDLKERCPSLTNDDLLYCILSLLCCSKDTILHIANVSADAIKTRKSRIKGKIDAGLFSRIFDY